MSTKATDLEVMRWVQDKRQRGENVCRYDVRKRFGIGSRRSTRLFRQMGLIKKPEELIKADRQVSKLARSLQLCRDENNRLRRINRQHDRAINITNAVINGLKTQVPLMVSEPSKVKTGSQDCSVIVQLSDLHAGETIHRKDTHGSNRYNPEIMSARLAAYAQECKRWIDYHNPNELYFVLTGDMINSDRRTDELISNASVRSRVFVQLVDLLAQFFLDITDGRRARVLSVCGNETRIGKELRVVGFDDSFDYLLHEMLGVRLARSELEFMPCNENSVILSMHGINIMIEHGHNKLPYDRVCNRGAAIDLPIHARISGHLHHTRQIDRDFCSGALSGANAYAYHKLGFASLPSQSVYCVSDNGINCYAVDLSMAEEPGYGLVGGGEPWDTLIL